MNGKRIVLEFLSLMAVVVVIFGLLTALVQGQYGNPYIPTNEYGTPDMSQIELTPVGHYEQCVAYCINTPLGSIGITMQYDLYADNYGNTWVVPSPMTVLVGAIFPEYIPEGLASRTDGWAYGSLLVGMVERLGGLEALGINTGGVNINTEEGIVAAILDYLRTLPDYRDFMIDLGLALGGADADWEPFGFELWQLSWIYPDNPFDPSDDGSTPPPGSTRTPQPTATRTPRPTATRQPTPTARPTATPIPTPIECPPESISQQPPMAQVLDLYPPNPVVKGQGGQGLNVTFLVVSFPVIHRWWVREPEYVCKWWDVATYGVPFGNQGHCCPPDNPDCEKDDYYLVPEGQKCVEHVEVIPDPILAAYLRADANLRRGSIEWIETDLAQKYPGAHVREPHLSARATGSPVIAADGRCLVEAVAHFDFSDPGYYDISVHAQTAGTQYTPPRSIDYVYPTPQPVYLIDTILLR